MIVKALVLLFRKSSEESVLPMDWKRANITALHKSSSTLSSAGYHRTRSWVQYFLIYMSTQCQTLLFETFFLCRRLEVVLRDINN